jgi:hypothetical protein
VMMRYRRQRFSHFGAFVMIGRRSFGWLLLNDSLAHLDAFHEGLGDGHELLPADSDIRKK